MCQNHVPFFSKEESNMKIAQKYRDLFDEILKIDENAKFKEQQRKIVRLEAISQGFTPPVPEPPALAYQDVEPDGDFGIYFNSNVAGLSFLETLNKGLGSRGQISNNVRNLGGTDF